MLCWSACLPRNQQVHPPCKFTVWSLFWPYFPYAKGAHNIPVVTVAVKLDADRVLDRVLDFPYPEGAHIIHVVTMAVRLDADKAPDVTCASVQCMSVSILRQDSLHTRSHTVYQQLLCAMCRQCSTHPQPHITKQTGNGSLSAAFRQQGHV